MMENKKVKFNGMDWFIVIVVLIVAAAGTYLLFGTGGEGVKPVGDKAVEVRAVVELTSQSEEFAQSIKEGDSVGVGEKEKVKTIVEKVEISPSKTAGYNILEGRVADSEVPGKYDIKITLVGKGVESDTAIKIDKTEIKVGQNTVLSSVNWAGQGFVIGLDTAEAE